MDNESTTWEEAAVVAAAALRADHIAHHQSDSADLLDQIEQVMNDIVADRVPPCPEDWQHIAEMALAAHACVANVSWATLLYKTVNTIIGKQYDYGHQNILWGERPPVSGLLIRAHDKVARLKNLQARGTAPKHEAVIDSWKDLVGYALIGIMVAEGTFTLPLAADYEPPARPSGTPDGLLPWRSDGTTAGPPWARTLADGKPTLRQPDTKEVTQ